MLLSSPPPQENSNIANDTAIMQPMPLPACTQTARFLPACILLHSNDGNNSANLSYVSAAPCSIPDFATMSRISFDGYRTVPISVVLPLSSLSTVVTTDSTGNGSMISVCTLPAGRLISRYTPCILISLSSGPRNTNLHAPPAFRSTSHT